MAPASNPRIALFALINVAFALLVGILAALSGYPDPRLVHLMLLFALCSSFVIDFDGINGRYAPLGLFMLVYFLSYGVGDLSDLLPTDGAVGPRPATPLLTKNEIVILVGGTMLVLGYRMAVSFLETRRPTRPPMDWSKTAILGLGAVFWTVGTIATYRWHVYIVTDTTNEAYRRGLASISPLVTTAYLLGQMCQPLGILFLAYAYRVFNDRYLLPVIVAVVIVQLFIGFVADVKGLAVLGLILVIMTSVLVNGRFPKAWLAGFGLFVVFLFPFYQAYRTAIHGDSGLTRSEVVENFGKVLRTTIAAKDRVNSGRDRAQTFLERGSLKGSTQIIVDKAGNGVPFAQGYTMSPMLETFIPKILRPDKVRIPTGQLFNKQFHVIEGDDIYVSPSHLGELYWNFGWPGVVLGMPLIGLICGWVGARFNLAEYRTVTRVLVTVVTLKQLIVGFEGAISDIYVVWLRSLAAIGLLHLIFARVPAISRFFGARDAEASELSPERSAERRLFPNLLT